MKLKKDRFLKKYPKQWTVPALEKIMKKTTVQKTNFIPANGRYRHFWQWNFSLKEISWTVLADELNAITSNSQGSEWGSDY